MVQEFRPRSPHVTIGGIPWLARMVDKARAKDQGSIGDYVYPCPMDRRLLSELRISPEDFQAITASAATDAEVLKRVVEAQEAHPGLLTRGPSAGRVSKGLAEAV